LTELSLGAYLRQERENRGMTLEQVASSTKINVKLLHALEADRYADLPALPFVRGFVASYCRFLGLNDQDVLTRHRRFMENKAGDRPENDQGHSGYAFEKKDAERSRALLWTVMGGMVVLGGVLMLLIKPVLKHQRVAHVKELRSSEVQDGQKKKAIVTATVQSAEASLAEPLQPSQVGDDSSDASFVGPRVSKPSERPKVSLSASTVGDGEEGRDEDEDEGEDKDPLNKGDALPYSSIKEKIVFRALENIWVRYRVDARTLTQFILLKGMLLELKGQNLVRFQVSNPRSVEFRYRSSKYRLVEGAKYLKESNETATLVFPPKDTEIIGEPFPGAAPLPDTPDPRQEGEINSEA